MQVYGSYGHRRDLVEAAKVPEMLSQSRTLHRKEAQAQVVSRPVLPLQGFCYQVKKDIIINPVAMQQQSEAVYVV